MEYRFLGRTGVQVSCLCFGTMSFGGDADEATSAAMYQRCRDAGINFFDTANTYSGGRSEEILGKLIAGNRDELILTSKVHFPTGPDINARQLTAEYHACHRGKSEASRHGPTGSLLHPRIRCQHADGRDATRPG
jgi:aryl-alcohol dehydrogenase-like predicted oxidoreductase